MPANYVNGGYATYGNQPCPRCKRSHELQYQIKEGSKARFIAMRIIAELSMVPSSSQGAKTWQSGKTKEQKLQFLRSKGMGQINDDHIWVLDFIYGAHAITLSPTVENLKSQAVKMGRKEKGVMNTLKDLVRMQLVTDTSGYLRAKDASMPVVFSGANKQFMLGVLVAGKKIFIAASGNNLERVRGTLPKLSHSLGTFIVCNKRSAQQGNNKTITGSAIEGSEYSQTLVDNDPGSCAAPRLIQQAMEDHEASQPAIRGNWEMTEIWYDPNTEADDSYVHGLSAKHCNTCAKLVPLLLCPS